MRRVLLTGGSRGIGRAVAEAFATKGDPVALYGHSAALLELPGEGHVGLACEVSNPTEVVRCLAEVAAGLGGLDVALNDRGLAEAGPGRLVVRRLAGALAEDGRGRPVWACGGAGLWP